MRPKTEPPRLVVAEYINEQPRALRLWMLDVGCWTLDVFFDHFPRPPLSQPRQRRIRIRQFQQSHLRVPNRQSQSVFLRRLVERGDTPVAQPLREHRRAADGREHFHRRNIQRIAERQPVAHRPVTTSAVILRAINAGRGREDRRHVRKHRRWCRAAFEREQIRERLDR